MSVDLWANAAVIVTIIILGVAIVVLDWRQTRADKESHGEDQ